MDAQTLAEMEELLASQKTLGDDIEKLINNTKKAGKNRRTVEYLETKLKALQQFAEEFQRNNIELEKVGLAHRTSEYYTNNYAKLILDKAGQYVQALATEIAAAQQAIENQQQQEQGPLIKRQQAMMASLKRLLRATAVEHETATSLNSKEKLWDQIQQLHFKVWETMKDPIENGYDMTSYMELECEFTNRLVSTKQAPLIQNAAPSTTNVPLPKINIPRFDGEYNKWHSFSNLFKEVVDKQPISTVQKFYYLKANLSGEAERLIKHLELTELNYKSAWDLLNDRYSNKRVLTATFVQQLVEHQGVTSDAKAIKGFHDLIQENLSALNNMDLNVSSWDPILLQILVKKLDRQTHVLYESQIKNPRELQTMDNFLKFLENRFQALEALGHKDKSKHHDNQSGVKTKATSAAVTSNQCRFCAGTGHAIYYCRAFKALKPSERQNWVTQQKLCSKCIKANHSVQSCDARSCLKCKKNHNSLLHPNTKEKAAKNTVPADTKSSIPIVMAEASQQSEASSAEEAAT